MKELHERNLKSLNAKFILETGRFVVCNAGSYYTKVVDRKISCGKTFIVVQNAMNGFYVPLLPNCCGKTLVIFLPMVRSHYTHQLHNVHFIF